MRKIKLFSFLLFICFFIIVSCNNSNPRTLTKESYERFVQNPPPNQEKLQVGTFNGCVHIPATGFVQKLMVGFEITGESCSITINEGNTITVSFLGDVVTSLVSASTEQYNTDIFIGELKNNQVLIVQHHQGGVNSVTQTIYDQNGTVVYGQSGQGDYIKECHFGMTTSEKIAGKKNCGK